MNIIYRINKGIDQPIEFRGLKAQYIWWLGGGIAGLLIFFAVLYIAGVDLAICLLVVFGLGAGLFFYVYKMSKQFGEYGMMKNVARKFIPRHLRRISRYSPQISR